MKAAVYIINRSPTKLPDGRWIIPWSEASEIDENKPKPRPNLANLRVYGCKAYVRRHGLPRAEKMQERAEIGYLVGYTASNIWRVWFPQRGAVRDVRDVIFDENARFDQKDLEAPPVRDVIEAMPWSIGDDDEEIHQPFSIQVGLEELPPQQQGGIQQPQREFAARSTAAETGKPQEAVSSRPQSNQPITPSPTPSAGAPSPSPAVGRPTALNQLPGAFPLKLRLQWHREIRQRRRTERLP